MPSRWWLPLPEARPDRVKHEHLHAAISAWFDTTREEHKARSKRFVISPLTRDRSGQVGCEVGLLERAASAPAESDGSPSFDPSQRLLDRSRPGTSIRLGSDRIRVGRPHLIVSETWESLATPSRARRWALDFVTPVTFRHGNRSSPLPAPATVLHSLLDSWNGGSGLPRLLGHAETDAVWVSDIAGRSTVMALSGLTMSGFTGQVTYRCDNPAVIPVVDALFRLAPYAGCGAARSKGLGVTRISMQRGAA